MRLAGFAALLLACVTSLVVWPLQQAHTFIYRGCAYRAVVGKEQALWFCLADNLCAMFFCQDNNVFSPHDCGCVPPHHRKHVTPPTPLRPPTVTLTTTTTTQNMILSSSVVLSAGGSHRTTPSPTPPARDNCDAEIQIEGLLAKSPSGGVQESQVYIYPHGVVDLGNGSTYYDGYSYLSVPMFRSANFPNGLTVEFVIQEEASALRQVLFTNCKQNQGASAEIVLDVELGVMLFHVMYRLRETVNVVESVLEVAVPYQAIVSKKVMMTFDGKRLRGRVNGNERSAFVKGHGDYVIAQRAKPFLFGSTLCDVDDVYSYTGQINQISIYRCAKQIR